MSYELIEKQVLYNGSRVRLELHHLRDEDSGSRIKKEICVHPGAVVILPITDDGQVLMIRNYRYGIGQSLLELPAGTLEKNEDPINCAGRELLEETGHLAGKLKSLGVFYTSPGILTERMYAWLATGLVKQTSNLDEGEQIEPAPMPLDEAIDLIRQGHIVDGKTIAALLMYDRFHRNR